MIVVATADFELYHEAVSELRDRGVAFTTVRPDATLPDGTDVVISAPGEDHEFPDAAVVHVVADVDRDDAAVRRAVEEALAVLRGGDDRVVVGVDPGDRPGVAVLAGETVVAAFQVPLSEVVDVVREEAADAADPLVRVGDGARLASARIVNRLDDLPVELVDETGTTPYLGRGARGMGDVLAAVNIARIEGERVDARAVEPTEGELQTIKNRSRELSETGRTIDERLARRVAAGELTVEEALTEHRDDGGPDDVEERDGESEGESEVASDGDGDG